MTTFDDKPKDECGVVAVFAPEQHAAKLAFYSLQSIQHRGQESAGLAASDGQHLLVHKDMGLVARVFDESSLAALEGHLSIGHVRYSTAGSSIWANAQPAFTETASGTPLVLAHNGNLTNTGELRELIGDPQESDKCTSDSLLLTTLLKTRHNGSTLDTLVEVLPLVTGAFSLTLADNQAIYAARDPHGVRPLMLGRLPDGGWVLASETCGLDIVGAIVVREIEPGEAIRIDEQGIESRRFAEPTPKFCAFEYVYIARPDHQTAETSVYRARFEMGKMLAEQYPVNADVVIGVPDSGAAAASGYAFASGIPYAEALQKNRYVGRTFIQPTQALRQLGIRMKLNPIHDMIDGKRLVVVDDSIVRGNTSRQLMDMLRRAGAKEIHLLVSSPPVKWPCFYGIDMASRAELIAADMTTAQMAEYLGADSVGYLSVEGLIKSTGRAAKSLCVACFTGEYPIAVEDSQMLAGRPEPIRQP
ncbi:amidophosphoribosyltransferase [Stomatohabitans albus]|uniref:amidophosphoribosyltransferase n=1 Tax=Stomatohabitans albus TaxID=3110766 RepID=UPI00300C9730